MNALDETLRALCEKHDLLAITLHVHAKIKAPYVNVHWKTADDQTCVGEEGTTMEQALANAIAKANAARAIAPEVPALEIGEIAA